MSGAARGAHRTPEGSRRTRQRSAVAEVLGRADGFRTAQELHDDLRRSGERVGLTTLYRNLQKLADTGEVDVLQNPEGEAMYRRCASESHHHHLTCRSCKRSVEVSSAEVERWAADAARAHGFTAATHTLEVFGLCSACSGA